MICEVVWKPGKRSLEAQHRVLVADNPARSAAIDSDLALCYPNDHRWDYVVVRQDGTGAAIEVHQARESEVVNMIAKKIWAESVLPVHAPGFAATRWHWVIPPNSPARITRTGPGARRLSRAGIGFPVRKLLSDRP